MTHCREHFQRLKLLTLKRQKDGFGRRDTVKAKTCSGNVAVTQGKTDKSPETHFRGVDINGIFYLRDYAYFNSSDLELTAEVTLYMK